jgi:hypothetical protein
MDKNTYTFTNINKLNLTVIHKEQIKNYYINTSIYKKAAELFTH